MQISSESGRYHEELEQEGVMDFLGRKHWLEESGTIPLR